MPILRVRNGPDKGRVYDITDEPITVGRDSSETIQILDQGASRRHSEVFRVGEMCFIRDLDSKNGTFVNDERIAEELLQVGDKIRIGNTIFVFDESGASMDVAAARKIEFDHDAPIGATIEIDLRKGERSGPALEGVTDSRSLRVLYALSKVLREGGGDAEKLLTKVTELTVDAVNADAGYVFVLEEGGKLMPRASVERKREEGRKISRAIVRRVIRTEKPVLTTDAMSDERWKKRESVILKNINSVMCVPLASFEKVTGVLYIHGTRMGEIFADEDFELVTAIGIQAGVALETLQASIRERRAVVSAVRVLVAINEMRDPATKGHSERVCTYAAAIGAQLQLSQRESQAVQLAALLHDIGKIVHSDHSAVRQANDPEFGADQHVLNGEKILRHMDGMEEVLPGIAFHHAHCDGSGFPEGVLGDDIPVIGKIVAVANAFDNMCTIGWDGGPPVSFKEALMKMGRDPKGWWDANVVEALLVAYRNGTLFAPEQLMLTEIVSAVEAGREVSAPDKTDTGPVGPPPESVDDLEPPPTDA
jgi:response regulator RpfG family c-di-GMP phosphodiesterase/pSer/pThr/pTyr-binding forkhead associated (FHA) protein